MTSDANRSAIPPRKSIAALAVVIRDEITRLPQAMTAPWPFSSARRIDQWQRPSSAQ